MLSFCGIDVSKDRLDVMVLPDEYSSSVPNDPAGWAILVEQQVQVLGNQIRILSNQLGASERQTQALSSHIQALDMRLKELEDDLRRRR